MGRVIELSAAAAECAQLGFDRRGCVVLNWVGQVLLCHESRYFGRVHVGVCSLLEPVQRAFNADAFVEFDAGACPSS